jgi:hypothetical protein
MAEQIQFVPSVGDYVFTQSLEGVQYGFRARWNARDAAWYFDIADAQQQPIANGIKIVLGCILGQSFSFFEPFTLGNFLAIDTSGEDREATFDDLGTRVVVVYYTTADLIASQLS